ncbi:hypothetical protein ACWY4P_40620 [Streptomyces sp. LZ34]
MTTRTRQLPPHGDERRYKGTRSGNRPPCRCTKCTRANRIAGARRALSRLNGEELLISRDILMPHIELLRASGMSQGLIARQAGISQSTISYLVQGKIHACQRNKALGILAVRPGQFDNIAERPSLGATRRARALYALGHSRTAIRAACGLSECAIGYIANGYYRHIDGKVDEAIRLAYRTLGRTPGTSWKARKRAVDNNWAPPAAWDDDTIDNPAAHPDWTGHCGTDHGWWLHRLNNIPTCQRCETAHQQWLANLGPATSRERFTALRKARAAASSRGADLADDARELMTLGYDHDAAAARLGITKEHLYQTLKRHPQSYGEAA